MAGEQQIEFGVDTSDPVALAAAFDKLEAGADLGEQTADNSAELAAQAAQAAEKAATEAAQAAEAAKVADDKSKTIAQESADAGKQGAASIEPEGIATKDGKHVIPYSVLQSERQRAVRAEQLAREAQEQLAALKTQTEAANKEAKPGDTARTTQQENKLADLSDEDLKTLEEDFPTVHKAVMASLRAAKALEEKFKPVEDSVRTVEEERQRTVADSVQDAIDATPKLAHIIATDPAAYELATQFDNTLKAQAAWKDKPLTERFAKVVELVEHANGAISIPGQKAPPASAKTAEQLKQEAQAAAAAAAKATKTTVPTSLSDFPAGEPAAKDEREAVESMTPFQLAEKFAGMSADQMDAYLSKI